MAERPYRVGFVTCSYDTAFEPIAQQVHRKLEQLARTFPADGPVRPSLWVVDDLPAASGFGRAVESAFAGRPELADDRHLLPMRSAPQRPGGLKGRALLDGFAAAIEHGADAVIYLNLNLKVDATHAAPAVEALRGDGYHAAIGTRAPEEGGTVLGAGFSGRLKSRGFNRLTGLVLPPLRRYRDTNAPLKAFDRETARSLVERARNPNVTMDCEWLLLLHELQRRVFVYPITWRQRPGSRPPWHLVVRSTLDLFELRNRYL